MRGDDQQQSGMFSYVSLEERIPQDHPLRPIRKAVYETLTEYLGAILPGLADVSIQKLAELTPAAWATRNR